MRIEKDCMKKKKIDRDERCGFCIHRKIKVCLILAEVVAVQQATFTSLKNGMSVLLTYTTEHGYVLSHLA